MVGAENLEHGKMSGNLSAGIWLGPGDTGESLEFLSRIILIIRMIWLQSAGELEGRLEVVHYVECITFV